jgi:hypothetical protein
MFDPVSIPYGSKMLFNAVKLKPSEHQRRRAGGISRTG